MPEEALPNTEIKENKLIDLSKIWVAVLRRNEITGNPEIIKENDAVVASGNLIEVQTKVEEIYPKYSGENNTNGKYIRYYLISQILDFKYSIRP